MSDRVLGALRARGMSGSMTVASSGSATLSIYVGANRQLHFFQNVTGYTDEDYTTLMGALDVINEQVNTFPAAREVQQVNG